MLRRMTTALGATAAILALAAAPASAAVSARPRTASFGSHGSVTMGYSNGGWRGSAHVVGLSPGEYSVWVDQLQYRNGHIAGGAAGTLCSFTIARAGDVGNCTGVSDSQLLGSKWRPSTYAGVDRLDNNSDTSVVYGQFK